MGRLVWTCPRQVHFFGELLLVLEGMVLLVELDGTELVVVLGCAG